MTSIAIDIREATGKGAGKGRYTEEITTAIAEILSDQVEFEGKETRVLLMGKIDSASFAKRVKKDFPKLEIKFIQMVGKGPLWHFNLYRYFNHRPVDLFLAPTSYIYPAIKALLPSKKQPKIALVVHDVISFLFPEHHNKFSTWVEKLTLGYALKGSKWLITVSENTYKDLKKLKPYASKLKHVLAPPAAGKDVKKVSTTKLKLPKKFLLAVGTLQPRKNMKTVLKAFEHLAGEQEDLHLCIAGGKGWKESEIIKAIPHQFIDRIHFLGYVDHKELLELYSQAQMLVWPSLYEGFGIPPLEAMKCECPVITSNASSLPEVVGDAAITIEPENVQALVEAIVKIQNHKNLEDFIQEGLKRVDMFSWSSSAEKIHDELF